MKSTTAAGETKGIERRRKKMIGYFWLKNLIRSIFWNERKKEKLEKEEEEEDLRET